MDLKLILPTSKYREQILKFKQDMLNSGSSMDGTGSLKNSDVDVWIKECRNHRQGKCLPEGFVPATQFICIRKSDNKIVGMLQIRHYLTDFLLNYGGHIGDCIAIDERRKGYGKLILKLGLQKCKKMGIKKVLVTCKDTNIASRKCILANGGRYEDTRFLQNDTSNLKNGINLERYWIELI